MINLIPPEAQSAIKREYWIRVFSLWAFLLACAFIALTLLQVPTYILLRAQLTAQQSEYAEATDQTTTFKEKEDALKNASAIATILTKKDERQFFSDILTSLERLVPAGVHIDSYSFTRKDTSLGIITLSGVADTRGTLSELRTAIEADSLFKTATLPLSNLAKDKDIPFSITVTPRTTKETLPSPS